jgi:hypothetical protein
VRMERQNHARRPRDIPGRSKRRAIANPLIALRMVAVSGGLETGLRACEILDFGLFAAVVSFSRPRTA